MSLNFHQLLLFYSVARLGSVTRAAKVLRISQPSVSAQLREFEQRHGVELLRRLPRGMALTDAGRLAFNHAQKVFAEADELQLALARFREAETGRLTIGGSVTAGEYFLPTVIRLYKQSYPKIELVLELHNSGEVLARVLRRELDLGFIGMEGAPTELLATPCWRDEVVVIAAPGAVKAGRPLPLSSLTSRRFVMREAGSGTRQQVERTLQACGIEPEIAIAMTVTSPEAVKRHVMAGVGWGFASRRSISMEVQAGHLMIVEVKGWSCTRDFVAVHRKDRTLSPAQAKFLKMATIH